MSGVSPTGNFVVATRSRVDTLPVSLLINQSGETVLTLETADPYGLPEGWQWPEPVTLKAADGETDIYAVVYRPPGCSLSADGSPDKHYPVLDFSSAHPAFTCVPRTSFINGPYIGRCYLEAAAYAALGFIVVAMDGPGEPYRRKALQGSRTDRMASAFGFTDRIAGLQQLATQFPSMDLDRVGIVSGLGVGDSVYGLLEYPEFYKVGVVFDLEDNRLMPSSWDELFKEPNQTSPSLYADQQAASLQGKLLLIHGMMDPEPPLAATMRLIEALQKANKDFDLLLSPNVGHDVSSYSVRRAWDYLVSHLQGVEPPKGFKLVTTADLLSQG